MRIPIFCPDIKEYLESPKKYLPHNFTCPRDPSHRIQWHSGWCRGLVINHIIYPLNMFRKYCIDCGESISFWPEFVLPHQPEIAETHEKAVVDSINGQSFTSIADEINYDPRTISRWVNRILTQAIFLAPRAITRMLKDIACEMLTHFSAIAFEMAKLLLAWLYKYAQAINFPRFYRLIGLCNVLGEGFWIIWGGAIGRCKYSREVIKDFPT